MRRAKEFYVVWLSEKNIPNVVTGPFENGEQAKEASLACRVLDPDVSFSIIGSEPWSIRDVPMPCR